MTPPKIEVPVLAELISRGDGSFILRPLRVATDDFGPWVSVKQAAKILSDDPKPSSIYSLLGEFLIYRRPLKSKVEVSMKSVLALRNACNDPDFWENPMQQEKVRKAVREGMGKLLAIALQGN